ncbi:elongation factor P [Qipengyuania atrilutea]|uniref:Elongation factor P n=1 Tax=Qipengyuania atrilutea TaxID=2744473 RepID=A0A850GZN1_9SPHN|nr:elongation factor P [Actirhodobacter atriluteus]NVD43680.1 elongation factor P [Actirhodobacter atriluteus]
MTKTFAALALAVAAVSAASAAPGGRIGTLPLGSYVCGLPGDATGEAWLEQEDMDFVLINGSSYRTSEGRGTYLLTGDNVRFTRGPMKGMRFVRETLNRLRKVEANGSAGKLRCIRRSERG